MSTRKKKFKNRQNQSTRGNYGTSYLDELIKKFPVNGTWVFLRASPETSKKCNHVEVGYMDNDIIFGEMVKYHDHIEVDTGYKIIKDNLENWDYWIDKYEHEFVQKRGCFFTSMLIKNENELREFFEVKTPVVKKLKPVFMGL
jgi:alpha-L-arabinofuranosidase